MQKLALHPLTATKMWKKITDSRSSRATKTYNALLIGRVIPYADVAQLVEHHLAKVRVASSNLVVRSNRIKLRLSCLPIARNK